MKNRRRHIGAHSKRRKTMISSKEESVLLDSAKIASSKAVRSSMALGLTIKVIRDHEIIAVNPDRSIKVIRKISKPSIDISALKKGMILEKK
jgi:hypothetical protein